MAVTGCELMRSQSGRIAIGNEQSHTLMYRVKCDGRMFGPAMILGAYTASPDPLPKRYEQWVPDGLSTGAYVLSLSYKNEDANACTWIVTVDIGKLPQGKQESDDTENPLDRPPKYRIEYVEETIVVEKDREGKPITNSVGDAPDSGLEDTDAYPIMVVDKNYATLQQIIDLGKKYHRTVNSATFYGGDPRTVKFLPIACSDVQNENGIEFYTATMRFAFNPKTWDREFLNRGWRYRKTAGGPLQIAVDEKTHLPVTSPVKLKLDGTIAPDGSEVYVKRQILEPKDYSDIGV